MAAGGPGSGPIATNKLLKPYLPPYVEKNANKYFIKKEEKSIGELKSFYGNFLVILRALAYLKTIGLKELKENSKVAILNANYLMKKLEKFMTIPYNKNCMHEFVAKNTLKNVKTLDIAKRLLDYNFHSPTVYFPLIFKEAMMIEPTETESKETLDAFVSTMKNIINEAKTNEKVLHDAPHFLSVSRLDEVLANKKLVLKHKLDDI